MGLSNDIISQFVKITNDKQKTTKNNTITYGEVSEIKNGQVYVVLDGTSEKGKKTPVPVSTTVNVAVNDRVIIMIKNHNAVITGNLGNPATNKEYVDSTTNSVRIIANEAKDTATDASNKVSQFGTVLTERLDATDATIKNLSTDNVEIKGKVEANEGKIRSLETDKLAVKDASATYATIQNLNTANAEIEKLKAASGDFEQIEAITADINNLKTNKMDANEANAKFATIESLNTTTADINDLKTDRITASQANAKFANIDFSNIGEAAIKKILADSGLIKNMVVGDGTITGKLVGVTISGDLIEGNTVIADKLVVKGEDGLYYKLNTDGIKTEAEQTDYNSLNGSIIKAKSITATKITVDDLVDFDESIGGFDITTKSIYSGTKSSVDNTTRGTYLDKEGQVAFGDSSNFIKYYKDTDGTYKLLISASSIILATSNKSVETAINEAVETLSVSGRNLIVRRNELIDTYVIAEGTVIEADVSYKSATTFEPIRIAGGKEYTLSKDASAERYFFRWAWYDENMNVLGRQATDISPTVWTAPANAAYVRISYPYVDGANPKFEKGSEATPYSPAIEDISEAINNAVELSANEIRTEMDEMEIGGRNLIKNSDFRHGFRNWESSGVTVSIENDPTYNTCLKMVSTEVGSSTQRIYPSTTMNFIHTGGTYALSFYAKADAATSLQTNIAGNASTGIHHTLTTEWKRFTRIYEASSGSLTFWPNEANTTIYITRVKVEKGDKTTDWTPAIEDMATSEDVEKAQSSAETAQEKADEAKALIAQLANSISMLVTDGNGTSLMTQTEDGWTFSTAIIEKVVNDTSEGLADLTKNLGDTNHVIDVLQQAINDLGIITEYVKITTYEDEPCIELGEGDSEFKLRITNTRMMFTEGSAVLAYFNNQSLHIKKAVVEEELQQGGFVWKARSNGNLGLVWKGGIS